MRTQIHEHGAIIPTDEINPQKLYDIYCYDHLGQLAWIQTNVMGISLL